MSISSLHCGGRRARLGAPIIPVNQPGAYLRHRVAVERDYRNRRRAAGVRRLFLVAMIGGLYLAIGRELIQLTRAKTSLLSTELRGGAHTFAHSIVRLLRPSRAADEATGTATAPLASAGGAIPADPSAAGYP
jgi:hypothetical protein